MEEGSIKCPSRKGGPKDGATGLWFGDSSLSGVDPAQCDSFLVVKEAPAGALGWLSGEQPLDHCSSRSAVCQLLHPCCPSTPDGSRGVGGGGVRFFGLSLRTC